MIGFAAETENVIEQASLKRSRKGCDWIVANKVGGNSKVMGGKLNEVVLICETEAEEWPEMLKEKVALKLVKRILEKLK